MFLENPVGCTGEKFSQGNKVDCEEKSYEGK